MRAVFTNTIIFLCAALLPAQGLPQLETSQDAQQAVTDACSQPATEQAALIREAEAQQYSTRRVEFLGNSYTRDNVLRREFVKGLNEGDLFTRRALLKSLRNVNRLKVIYPVRERDVVVRLERDEKIVDRLICFRERRRLAKNSFAQRLNLTR